MSRSRRILDDYERQRHRDRWDGTGVDWLQRPRQQLSPGVSPPRQTPGGPSQAAGPSPTRPAFAGGDDSLRRALIAAGLLKPSAAQLDDAQ